jgi:hypothetical protein
MGLFNFRKKHLNGLMGFCLLVTAPAAWAVEDEELEAQFKEGMEALEDNRLKTAIEAFNSILSSEPSLHRARLELAVAYYRSLQFEEARRLAQEVLDDPTTPPQVRVTILAFLAQVDKDAKAAEQRHEFKPFVSAGYLYDSNATVGPSVDTIEINGIEVPITAGQEQSDTALVLSGGVSHRYNTGKTFTSGERVGQIGWLSQLSMYSREYQDVDNSDQFILSASTGPAWVVLREWRAALNLRLDKIWLGDEELALFTSLNPLVTYQFNNGELTFTATVTDRSYDDSANDAREGTYITGGTSLGIYFNQRKVATQAGLNLFNFDAEDDQWSNDGWELFAGAIVKAWPQGQIYTRASLKSIEYDDPALDLGSSLVRDDTLGNLVIGFSHEFSGGYLEKWKLNGSYNMTDNDSNVVLTDYERQQIGLNLSKTF